MSGSGRKSLILMMSNCVLLSHVRATLYLIYLLFLLVTFHITRTTLLSGLFLMVLKILFYVIYFKRILIGFRNGK